MKSVVIEGNGATLTQSGFIESDTSQLLRIDSLDVEVRISRLHFKGGRSRDYGAAIRNAGTLTLESCIFSDNTTSLASAYGGAIYATGATSISGCTFAGNAAGTATSGYGGAIYATSGTLTLTGNILVGNTAATHSVVRKASGSAATGSYNVSDKPSGTGNAQSGWSFGTGDTELTDVVFDGAFKPSSDTGLPVMPSLPAGFPATYFDGTNRGSNSTPGAMPKN
jgi:predicted outer membrane repeat protein